MHLTLGLETGAARPWLVRLAGVLLLTTNVLLAGRVEFNAQFKKQHIDGADVCFFAASDSGSPFAWFFSSNDVRCVTADKVIEVPPGRWNFFLRQQRDGYVSAHLSLITIPSEHYIPELGFHRVDVAMFPSAHLNVAELRSHLAPGEYFVIYYPRAPDNMSSSAQALASNQDLATVPADTPLIPLVVKDGFVARVLNPITARPGTTVSVPWRVPASNTVDLVAWIKVVADDVKPDVLVQISDPFQITVHAHGEALSALFAPPIGAAAHMNLQFVLDAPGPPSDITLRGDRWETTTISGQGIVQGTTLNITEPLVARPAGLFRVSFTTGERTAGFHVRLLSCPGLLPDDMNKSDTSRCRMLREDDRTSADIEFTGLTPGLYVLEVFKDPLHLARKALYAAAGIATHVTITDDPSATEAQPLILIEADTETKR